MSLRITASGGCLDGFLDRCKRIAVDPRPYIHASRMAAKAGCAILHDGYQKVGSRQ